MHFWACVKDLDLGLGRQLYSYIKLRFLHLEYVFLIK